MTVTVPRLEGLDAAGARLDGVVDRVGSGAGESRFANRSRAPNELKPALPQALPPLRR